MSAEPAPEQQEEDEPLELSFAEIVSFGLNEIEEEDKLSVIGYFRQRIATRYNIRIPSEIIDYVLIYLHYDDESDLYMGNLHEAYQTANPQSRNRHCWTMFISASKDRLQAPKSIAQVRYFLHPTFRPPHVDETKPPYHLRRIGWGTFNVEALISFKPQYRRQPCYAIHALSFSNYASLTKIDFKQKQQISTSPSVVRRREFNFKAKEEFAIDTDKKK